MLSAAEADAIFFPGPGGKVSKARKFCGTCPFLSGCLQEAIEKGWEGFYAGTTTEDRKEMRKFRAGLVELSISELIDSYVPEIKVVKRKVFRKIIVTPDPYSYLDEIEPSIHELV